MNRLQTPEKPSKGGFMRRMGDIMNRATGYLSMRLHVAMANTWRDGYNPLRSLTIMRAVHLLEDGERGAYADLQWTYRFIEMQDATLGALVERRTSAIQELDWDIKTRSEIPAGKEAVAKRQYEGLKQGYQKITNLSAAFEAMAMASFRGFTRLEKVTDELGDIVELAPVDQWFWVRRGLYGAWKLNRQSQIGTVDGEDVPEPRFVSREVSRPINRVALIAFVRKALSQKDWDGFIETYGIPAVFIVMPEDVPEEKSDEYLEMADQVTGDARGVLPGGSEVKTVDNGARGNNPFKDHIAYQDEQVVLRGTGGKLTMLAESGSGTLGGSVHAETFQAIARAEAAEISEIFRKCIDAEIIERVTPGEDAYAYFELAANEEMDPAQVVKDLVSLEAVDLQADEKWIEEKTGYPVKRKATSNIEHPTSTVEEKILNRADGAEVWKKFARETGTLGIPREIMPQIHQGNRAAVVNFFKARGIGYARILRAPSDLKPSQAEYCPAKVEAAIERDDSNRALLVSSDNYVIDGHHQYLAKLQTYPNRPIEVFVLKAPAMQVIGMLLAMPSTTTADMPIKNSIREDLGDGPDDFEALSQATLAEALGVRAEVLAPISDLIGGLQGGGMDDATWLQFVTDAAEAIPELFDPADAEALAADLEAAMGTAVLIGVRSQIQESRTKKTES
jgi:phage gp29-like protein